MWYGTWPTYTATWSFSLGDFFQGIIIEDLLLNLWKAVRRATRKREPTMIPVTTSRARSQVGLDVCWRLDSVLGGWCFKLSASGWILTREEPSERKWELFATRTVHFDLLIPTRNIILKGFQIRRGKPLLHTTLLFRALFYIFMLETVPLKICPASNGISEWRYKNTYNWKWKRVTKVLWKICQALGYTTNKEVVWEICHFELMAEACRVWAWCSPEAKAFQRDKIKRKGHNIFFHAISVLRTFETQPIHGKIDSLLTRF